MRLNAVRPAVPARCSRGDLAGRLEPPNPAYSAGDADPKTLGRRIARHAPFYYSAHNTFAKIVRKRHHPPPPSRGEHQQSQTDMIRESGGLCEVAGSRVGRCERRPHISRIERRRGPVGCYGESAGGVLILNAKACAAKAAAGDGRTG